MWTVYKDSRHKIGQSNLDTKELQGQCPNVPFITPSNARELQARSMAARKAAAIAAQSGIEPYVVKRLARIRAQLDLVDSMIEKETDPAKLDRLASAQERLARQEQALAMRPGPGVLKPSSDRKARSPQALPAPEPISQPATPAPPASS